MTQMQMTSLIAYNDAKKNLNHKQQLVYEAISQIQPCTNRNIAKHLGWEINSVTPRVLELRLKNKVKSAYIDTDNGRKANFWALI